MAQQFVTILKFGSFSFIQIKKSMYFARAAVPFLELVGREQTKSMSYLESV